ncbi:SDR family NAD(P)-dependent oxidoreductase [Kineosporia rhizophila]|uniref:SDR family NAD(P)-dependent oxidoreductase n=1 Tax=Kineosporia rhizophila TaxID=84633 RepID=UPI001E34EC62|nr:SDR family NAD(P)-dependent oxidoreductase [Kineosporia rhizophila]MCE0534597.1 SDR family NAD(P)-dependent oxidoreductase [Kineosporia rhizophila]
MITTSFSARTTASEILEGVDLTGRRALVTGGASGLGAATVQALADAGAQVTVATRNPDPASSAVRLDLSDLQSVKAFVQNWHTPLDIVVANAGVMAVPARQVTAEGWELQLATNFLGHFALVTGLREHLRPGARVVVVSSGIQRQAPFDFEDPHFERRAYDPWSAYAQSKVADVLLAVGITRRTGVMANALNPGYIHTNLQRHVDAQTMRALGGMDEEGNLVTPDYYKTPEQGAATSVLLAASPLVEGVGGRYFEDNQELPVVKADADGPGVAEWSVDPGAADRLWDYAASVVVRAWGGR